jgi:multiple sugar transport system permease protein
MFLGGSWQLRELETNLAPAEYAKWDIAPIPQAEAGTVSTGTGGWVWVTFSRDPVRRKAAVELIRAIESPENVARISLPTHQLPVRRSVYRDAPFFREDPFHARFGELLAHARARPAVSLYPAISEQLQLAIGSVVAGDKPPERALDDAWRAVEATVARETDTKGRTAGGTGVGAVLPVVLAAILVVLALLPVAGRGLLPWLLPALLAVAGFILYPMLDLVRLSFTDTRTHGAAYRYTLDSFRALGADPDFPGMVGVTLVFVAASVALQIGIGLALAVLIDSARRRGARGTLLARVAVVGAWVVPGVLVGVLWRILLVENRAGIANYTLSLFGLGPLPFLSAGGWALVSVVVANVWRGCAFSMILQYAGLQRIPRELHEAADLEGISAGGRLRLVILPQIAPVLALNLALATIATLNTFDSILPLTGGGPARRTEVISLYMYRSAFFGLETGRAAAVAMVMLLLNVGLALVAARLTQRPRGVP